MRPGRGGPLIRHRSGQGNWPEFVRLVGPLLNHGTATLTLLLVDKLVVGVTTWLFSKFKLGDLPLAFHQADEFVVTTLIWLFAIHTVYVILAQVLESIGIKRDGGYGDGEADGANEEDIEPERREQRPKELQEELDKLRSRKEEGPLEVNQPSLKAVNSQRSLPERRKPMSSLPSKHRGAKKKRHQGR